MGYVVHMTQIFQILFRNIFIDQFSNLSRSIAQKTESKKTKGRQYSGFGRKKTFSDYTWHVRAHKCGFIVLCLLCLIIATAILGAAIVATRKNTLDSHHETMRSEEFTPIPPLVEQTTTAVRIEDENHTKGAHIQTEVNVNTTITDLKYTTAIISTSEKISRPDDLNKICQAPPKGRRCSYHRGLVRRNCTHLTCESVIIDLKYNLKLETLSMLKEKDHIFDSPAMDGEPCLHENSMFGHCRNLECMPGAPYNEQHKIQDNEDDIDAGTWRTVENASDPEVCLNLIPPKNIATPWQKYAYCNNTDHNRSCTSIGFRVRLRSCLVPKKPRFRSLSCFDKNRDFSELLPIEMVICPNTCPELKSSEKNICKQTIKCVTVEGRVLDDFSLCCFTNVKGGISHGRCMGGLCLTVKAERKPETSEGTSIFRI